MQLTPICIHVGLDFTFGVKKTRKEIFFATEKLHIQPNLQVFS